ncbi:hypothetical protein EST38_g907 [Candolleomyces aberdarensis]|uniref:Uncharacterized protein n=1 Tax=Candolleomyces aberdarensis TaxID=2316362 RepID=A0A4Q2DXG8_9AGAR|nr:hypothetical protein EST38_g907 [Candolleomyces aberdarensis]
MAGIFFPLTHPLYYNQDGNVVIQAGNTLFRLDDAAISALPYNFTRLLREPLDIWTPNGGDRYNNARPLRLPGRGAIGAKHFERYLWVFCPVPGAPAIYQMTADDWFKFLKCFLVLQASFDTLPFRRLFRSMLSGLFNVDFDSLPGA